MKAFPRTTREASTPRQRAKGVRPPRILLAEDDVELRGLMASSLREDGYDVFEALDGGRLLVQITAAYAGKGRNSACDVIVSDIRMPVCSGVQILEALRRAHWTTPVILVTAFGNKATRRYVESLRALLFCKPFDVDDLRTAVTNILLGYSSE
jgi:DNA-binding response OmpR family regulator